jgi:mRNA interferase RelE/StbE
VPYTLLYHPDIKRRDLPRVPLNVQSRIADALAVRLQGTPEKYGQPLRGTLRGYWKLRVGDYRVVFKIVGDEAWVLAILHKGQVYEDVLRRIERQPA